MPNLNKVMLIGNLTRDPEIKYTPKGSAVAEIALAINRSYSTDQGEKREETTFVDVVLYGRLAETAGGYLRKGHPAYIDGRLKLDTWDDKQTGQKRSKMRVVGESLQLLGGKESGERSDSPPAQSGRQTSGAGRESKRVARAGNVITHDDLAEEDIPF